MGCRAASLPDDPVNNAAKVLLKTEMNAGHGGISGRYERWKEAAFQYAWLLDAAKANHNGVSAHGNERSRQCQDSGVGYPHEPGTPITTAI